MKTDPSKNNLQALSAQITRWYPMTKNIPDQEPLFSVRGPAKALTPLNTRVGRVVSWWMVYSKGTPKTLNFLYKEHTLNLLKYY